MTWFWVYLRGMMMGAADIVPGVSGGTIAFVTGIYERLLEAISHFLPALLAFIRHRSTKRFLAEADIVFVSTLLFGILSSVFLFASLISFALEAHPIQIWSFFSGLIIASAILIGFEIKAWPASRFIMLGVGVVVAVLLGSSSLFSLPHTFTGAFLSGAIAICAMILPGISGSFLLLLIGTYSYIIGSIKNVDLAVLSVFALGCCLSLLFVARLISWMLERYKGMTLCFLLGLMLGSIDKVWPWKYTISYRLNSKGESVPLDQMSVLPSGYAELTGAAPELLSAALWFGIGFIVITGVTYIARLVDASSGTSVTNGNA
ncbi:hypothetical protein A3742_04590 [Oleiphilus sp. HI0071]|uniref:DUF368 domain-containing protein n=1 Tax=unclassified Oleiphilus TaxID=2631174 RepID=UPI0007C3DFC8|nr:MULTISPECIES: DUF368 domain-containing protein [unclassified Oleiphilus]KZY63762.1 hypothetical protein A3737_03500 [Oleiphilus sp. HI0065]KZY86462.1 hypothetical protein A3742_04590 [Oleiphilus sp. HI0071]KZZ06018.1 hypothetical protein A3744_06985 [Oleiphilus sp. HI0073]KZZ51423.1 hypothetical protein A3760_12955 [Oleiphilus sp. HI0122]KZZ51504.1 hypothetical protein A3758_11845 [Oleiphilus sp. HI0118]KZZ74045.1 hypothetical protein A3765_11845 [Oleiphilus sp. HI0130]KZZ79711.1 hypothet